MVSQAKITGIKEFQTFMNRLKGMAKEKRQVMRLIAEMMRKMQVQHFDKQEDDRGQPWAPLAPGTIKARSKRVKSAYARTTRKGLKMAGVKVSRKAISVGASFMAQDVSNYPILQVTGRLLNSLAVRSTSQTAMVGTNVKYATTHQFGDASRNIPKRKYLYLTDKEANDLFNKISWDLIYEKFQK